MKIFFQKCWICTHKAQNSGISMSEISNERQGKIFESRILETLKLLPAFLSGYLVSYSPRYDFMKLNIYLSQLSRNVLKTAVSVLRGGKSASFLPPPRYFWASIYYQSLSLQKSLFFWKIHFTPEHSCLLWLLKWDSWRSTLTMDSHFSKQERVRTKNYHTTKNYIHH